MFTYAGAMLRHFTVSGFLVDGGRTALHWHRRSQMWLPAGGHVEANEDPVQAVVREVLEETGIEAAVVGGGRRFSFEVPVQIAPPMTIQIEDIPWAPAIEGPGATRAATGGDDGGAAEPREANIGAKAQPQAIDAADGPHQHIDMIYALRPLRAADAARLNPAFSWISEAQLRSGEPIALASCGVDVPPPEDVRELGIAAIALVREAGLP